MEIGDRVRTRTRDKFNNLTGTLVTIDTIYEYAVLLDGDTTRWFALSELEPQFPELDENLYAWAYMEYQLREMYWEGGPSGAVASDILFEQFGVTP